MNAPMPRVPVFSLPDPGVSDCLDARARELPYLDAEGMVRADDPELAAKMAEHLSTPERFAQPIVDDGEVRCVCGSRLTGLLVGTFTWHPIVHGEGQCSACGWPGRAYHYVEHNGRRELLNAVLLYHPDALDLGPVEVPS